MYGRYDEGSKSLSSPQKVEGKAPAVKSLATSVVQAAAGRDERLRCLSLWIPDPYPSVSYRMGGSRAPSHLSPLMLSLLLMRRARP